MTAENFAPFEEAATVDPTVDRLRLRADTDAGRLYEVEWADSEVELLEWIADNDVTILQADANSDDERWHLKLRFPSQDAASAFHQHCDDRGVRFELVRMFNLVAAKAGQFNMTEKQYEALLTAVDLGYYNIPRDVTLAELAEELGISTGAASERLRRGQINLINNSLRIGHPTGIGLPETPGEG